jgi:hypothetical protein
MLYRTVVSVSSCEQVPRHQAHQTLCWLAWVKSGVALFCEAVVDGLTTMLQEDHICVQTSSCHPCVTVCLQLAGSAWLFFEENPAFHVNAIEVCWLCGTLIFRNEVQQATTWTCQEYPLQSGVSPHPFHCFIIAV